MQVEGAICGEIAKARDTANTAYEDAKQDAEDTYRKTESRIVKHYEDAMRDAQEIYIARLKDLAQRYGATGNERQ